MQRAAADPVVGKAPIPIPAFEIKRAIPFMAQTIEGAKETVELVAVEQDAAGVLVQDLTQLLHRRVIDDVATAGGRGAVAA